MKHLIFITLVFAGLASYAQKDSTNVKTKVTLPLKDSLITYEEVVTLDSTYTPSILYKATKTWFVKAFKNAKSVIQSDDAANGLILAKGTTTIPVSAYIIGAVAPDCEFTVQIDVKKGKYRYRIFGFQSTGTYMGNPIKADMSMAYSKYLHSEYKPHGLLGINKMYGKFNETFGALGLNMQLLVRGLKATMANSKKDDF